MEHTAHQPRHIGWRIALWGALLALLALPAIAMQWTDEVNWSPSDFVFAAILLGALGAGIDLALRMRGSWLRRLAIATFALASFLTLWINAAVGIIGDEDSINMGFTIMVIAAIAAAALVRMRAPAMANILALAACVPMVLGVVATVTMPGHQVEWIGLAIVTAFWLAPAAIFHLASRRERQATA